MLEPKAVTEEDLQKILDVQSQYIDLARRCGELYFQRLAIEQEQQLLNDEMKTLESSRIAVITELQQKYGAGTLNIQTGQFIPD